MKKKGTSLMLCGEINRMLRGFAAMQQSTLTQVVNNALDNLIDSYYENSEEVIERVSSEIENIEHKDTSLVVVRIDDLETLEEIAQQVGQYRNYVVQVALLDYIDSYEVHTIPDIVTIA